MATEYLVQLLERAYADLETAVSVARELTRDRVIERDLTELAGARADIAGALARIPRV